MVGVWTTLGLSAVSKGAEKQCESPKIRQHIIGHWNLGNIFLLQPVLYLYCLQCKFMMSLQLHSSYKSLNVYVLQAKSIERNSRYYSFPITQGSLLPVCVRFSSPVKCQVGTCKEWRQKSMVYIAQCPNLNKHTRHIQKTLRKKHNSNLTDDELENKFLHKRGKAALKFCITENLNSVHKKQDFWTFHT